MLLKEFLIKESNDFTVEDIIANCKPYLDKIKGISESSLATHGSAQYTTDKQILIVSDKRPPRDTNRRVHDAVNDFLEEKFGWRAREDGIFVTGSNDMASQFGAPYYVFPIGEFKYLWSSSISDLTTSFADIKFVVRKQHDIIGDETWKEYDKRILDIAIPLFIKRLEKNNWNYNSHLIKGLNSGKEVIFYSPKMYLVKVNTKFSAAVLDALAAEGITNEHSTNERHVSDFL